MAGAFLDGVDLAQVFPNVLLNLTAHVLRRDAETGEAAGARVCLEGPLDGCHDVLKGFHRLSISITDFLIERIHLWKLEQSCELTRSINIGFDSCGNGFPLIHFALIFACPASCAYP